MGNPSNSTFSTQLLWKREGGKESISARCEDVVISVDSRRVRTSNQRTNDGLCNASISNQTFVANTTYHFRVEYSIDQPMSAVLHDGMEHRTPIDLSGWTLW